MYSSAGRPVSSKVARPVHTRKRKTVSLSAGRPVSSTERRPVFGSAESPASGCDIQQLWEAGFPAVQGRGLIFSSREASI
jgi:hypothetical protein